MSQVIDVKMYKLLLPDGWQAEIQWYSILVFAAVIAIHSLVPSLYDCHHFSIGGPKLT